MNFAIWHISGSIILDAEIAQVFLTPPTPTHAYKTGFDGPGGWMSTRIFNLVSYITWVLIKRLVYKCVCTIQCFDYIKLFDKYGESLSWNMYVLALIAFNWKWWWQICIIENFHILFKNVWNVCGKVIMPTKMIYLFFTRSSEITAFNVS